MSPLSKHKTGLSVGAFYAFFHLFWAGLVAFHIAKPLLNWMLSLHFLSISYEIQPFHPLPAFLLILMTFFAGYLTGWIFAALWNFFHSWISSK